MTPGFADVLLRCWAIVAAGEDIWGSENSHTNFKSEGRA